MIVALLVQTAGAIWWAASISAEVKYVKETQAGMIVAQAIVDRRQDDEAKRSEDRIIQRIDALNLKLDRMIEPQRSRH